MGIYISALINKIITEEDIITLRPNEELDGMGLSLQKGTLIIESNVKNNAGKY